MCRIQKVFLQWSCGYKGQRCNGRKRTQPNSKGDSGIMAMKLKAELKKAVAENLDNIRGIYNSIVSTYPQNIQNMVPWKSVRRSLYKVMKTSPPTLEAPGDPENRCKICLAPPAETCVITPSVVAVVISSYKINRCIRSVEIP